MHKFREKTVRERFQEKTFSEGSFRLTLAQRRKNLSATQNRLRQKCPQSNSFLPCISLLIQFKNKLQAVVHTYIVSQLLTSEERTELLGLFRSIDKNENGILDLEEIKQVLKNSHLDSVDEAKIKMIIDYVDTNCSGQIDYT